MTKKNPWAIEEVRQFFQGYLEMDTPRGFMRQRKEYYLINHDCLTRNGTRVSQVFDDRNVAEEYFLACVVAKLKPTFEELTPL